MKLLSSKQSPGDSGILTTSLAGRGEDCEAGTKLSSLVLNAALSGPAPQGVSGTKSLGVPNLSGGAGVLKGALTVVGPTGVP